MIFCDVIKKDYYEVFKKFDYYSCGYVYWYRFAKCKFVVFIDLLMYRLNKIKNYIKNNKYLNKYDVSKRYFVLNKTMVSRGVFIGLFIAMIPMPAQMLAIFLITFMGKFNFPIAIAMCWITNPFTMPFIYYIQYMTGMLLIDMKPLEVEMSIQWFNDNFSNIIVPLYLGALCYSVSLSTLAYYSIKLYWGNKKIRIR